MSGEIGIFCRLPACGQWAKLGEPAGRKHPALPQAALVDDGQRAAGESASLLSPSFGGRGIQVNLSIISEHRLRAAVMSHVPGLRDYFNQ